MILHFCPLCGSSTHGPRLDTELQPLTDWDAQAIRGWQEEIAATCAHVPKCGGPWQHAWYSLKEVLIAREKTAAAQP